MKIDRKKLLEALSKICLVAERQSNMPILTMCLIDGPGQRITGTDLETSMAVAIPISDYQKTVPAEVVAVDEVPEDLLEGLKLGQLIDLAKYDGVTVPKKPTVPGLQKAIMKVETAKYEAEKAEAEAKAVPRVFEEQFCLPARTLRKIAASMPDEVVEISTGAEGGSLFTKQQLVNIGANFQGIATLPAGEFPMWEEPDFSTPRKITGDDGKEIELAAGTNMVSSEQLAMVIPATTKEEAGFKLSTILLDEKNGNMVSTDGHRMHLLSGVTVTRTMLMSTEFARVLIALKAEKLELETDGQNIKATLGDVHIVARCVPAKFPDYTAVIPKKAKHHMEVLREALETPLKQALIIGSSTSPGVKITFNGGIDVEYRNPDLGGYQKVQVPIVSGGVKGTPLEVGINPKYILDALGNATKDTKGKIKVALTDHSSPITFVNGNFMGLVMPMRI